MYETVLASRRVTSTFACAAPKLFAQLLVVMVRGQDITSKHGREMVLEAEAAVLAQLISRGSGPRSLHLSPLFQTLLAVDFQRAS